MPDLISNVPGTSLIRQSRATAAWPEVAVSPELEFLRNQTSADPGGFFNFAQAVQLPALVTLAPNTQRAYASDWRSFVRFCKEADLCPTPTTPGALEAFIEFSAEYSAKVHYQYVLPEVPRQDVKASTIQRAITAIGAVHEWLGYRNPAVHADVLRTLRTHTHERTAKQSKAPLSYSAIERALPTYGTELRDLRAKALVTMAFSTNLSRSDRALPDTGSSDTACFGPFKSRPRV
jgi:site-specific recombinase XerD